ncbi:MAG: EAL domain-containing protein [Synechococcales cyanobacterium RM1_1_8]|nr:EAL domain-containing protein [Synechococcales cyanobacterium RM1_1_8]
MAKTIVELGHSLSMDVIAEGVEKPEQAAALLILGCEYGQGYFFSKPALDIDAEQLLQQKPAWDY